MRIPIRVAVVAAVVLLVLLTGAEAAAAQADDEARDDLVVLTGRAEVAEGETLGTVFIADGPVVVDGTVHDGVIAFNGDVTVRGTVEEDVVALNGDVRIVGSGRVGGDVIARRAPVVEEGAQLDGSFERWNPAAWSRGFLIVGRLVLWLAMTVSTLILGLLLGLLAPRAAVAVDRAGRDSTGPVIGWGLLLAVGLPLAAVLLLVTVLAFPLGIGVLLALGLIYGVGYTTAAWLVGARIVKGDRWLPAFLAGWGILRVIALVPVLGGLVWFAAVVVGLGAIAVAVRRARTPYRPAAATPF